MSPLEIPKLTPVNAASSLRAKDGNTPTVPARAPAAAPIAAQASEGVKVELGAAAAKGGAPVDAARVEAIREALREGT